MIQATGFSETGLVRSHNEDTLLIADQIGIFAVADGMGGLPNGKLASETAIATLEDIVRSSPDLDPADILVRVNAICRTIGFKEHFFGFGTTLSFIHCLDHDAVAIGHVGDSGIAMVRAGKVEHLTTEHTVAARIMAESGTAIDVEPSDYHALTQCIGQENTILPQSLIIQTRPGDRLLIFSDGCEKPLSEKAFHKIVSAPTTPSKLFNSLQKAIVAAGAPDNYTLVVVDFTA